MNEERTQKIDEYIPFDPFAQLLDTHVEILKPGRSSVTLTGWKVLKICAFMVFGV